jgi:hypothetical protein
MDDDSVSQQADLYSIEGYHGDINDDSTSIFSKHR